MEVARDLASRRTEQRLVAEDQRPVVDLLGDLAPARGRRRRDRGCRRSRRNARARSARSIMRRSTSGSRSIAVRSWKELPRQTTVSGCSDVDQRRQHRQRLARVVARQQLARIDGVGRALLEMQVGHRQQTPCRPVQGACRQCLQLFAGAVELEGHHGWITCRRGRRNTATMSRKLMARTIDPMTANAQGGAMRRLVGFVLAGAVLAPGLAGAQVQPHRAEYALRLGIGGQRAAHRHGRPRSVAGLRRLASQARHQDRDRAHGLVEDEPRLQARRPGAEERQRLPLSAPCRSRTAASASSRAGCSARAASSGPRSSRPAAPPNQFVLPPPTLMPVAAIDHLIERLRAKAANFPALMFDAEVMGDAFLIEVTEQERGQLRAARPADKPVAAPTGKSWPVFMTFTRGRQQDPRPLFTRRRAGVRQRRAGPADRRDRPGHRHRRPAGPGDAAGPDLPEVLGLWPCTETSP